MVPRSSSRSSESGMNFTLRLSAVICVLPVRGILRILPCLWRTSNLPKEGSFRVKRSVLMFSVVAVTLETRTVLTTLFASRSELRPRAARTRDAIVSRPTCGPFARLARLVPAVSTAAVVSLIILLLQKALAGLSLINYSILACLNILLVGMLVWLEATTMATQILRVRMAPSLNLCTKPMQLIRGNYALLAVFDSSMLLVVITGFVQRT